MNTQLNAVVWNSKKQEINKVKTDITELKKDMSDIKDLLRKLLEKGSNG